MRRRRRLFGALLIAVALVIMTLPVSEADAATSASDFVMEGSTLVKYRGTDTAVSVPDTVEVIGESAFEDNTAVEQVALPNSVEKIEAYAFWGCDNLTSVTLGKGMSEVGDYAFANCKGLKQMVLPSNIVSVGVQAFADCVNMTDITIPAETLLIHDTAFDGCAKLVIHCETGTPADVFARDFYVRQKEMAEYEDVPGYRPGDDSQEDVVIPNPEPPVIPEPPAEPSAVEETLGSTSIVGNSAFVFMNPGSMAVKEPVSEPEQGTVPGTGSLPTGIGNLAEAVGNLFSVGPVEKLPKYTVVDGRIVADQAFYRSELLEEVTLPGGIEEIGQFSFARSTLAKITIPEGVTDIGYGAFYHCDGLKQVELPDSVMNVEPRAFDYTAWLKDFYASGEEFLITGGVLVAYAGNDSVVSVPGGVRVIAAEVFAGHGEIESVRLPDSLLVIGEAAFENCTGLRQVHLGESVRSIKDRAFRGCVKLEVLKLPVSVEEAGLLAFGSAEVLYGGKEPERTFEASATRLSNEENRGLEAETVGAGVTVSGSEPSGARLEGASRSYTLTVEVLEESPEMEAAWERLSDRKRPEKLTVYSLLLCDSSQIPLTKLGRCGLTVILPVPESLLGQELGLVTLDRNGQLEQLGVERVMMEGTECFRFRTTQLSLLGLYGEGPVSGDKALREVSVNFGSMSAPPSGGGFAFTMAKCMTGAALLVTGSAVFLSGGFGGRAGRRRRPGEERAVE